MWKRIGYLVGAVSIGLGASAASDDWRPLFDGRSLAGWSAVARSDAFQAADGQIVVEGPGGRLLYVGEGRPVEFENFEFQAEVFARPGARCALQFHTMGGKTGPMHGREIRIDNSVGPVQQCRDLAKTGSLVGLRQQFRSIVADDQWFTLRLTVRGRLIQVRINGTLLVDYLEPGDTRHFRPHRGTFALVSCAGHTRAFFKNPRLAPLPRGEISQDAAVGTAGKPAPVGRRPEAELRIAGLQQAGFPLIDFHIHLKGGLTLEEALAQSRQKGIYYGIAANCGLKFPITDDCGIDEYLKKMAGQGVFVGMQAEGREWPRLFSKEAIARFDYVFTDAMTIVDHRGRRARLWIKDEVEIPDKQAFMELLVRTIVDIMDHEPLDIYVNPTYLPEVIAKEYDALWTPARLQKVIEAAAANGVAIEISDKLQLPKPDFIRQAKLAGIKFTLGSNNSDRTLGGSDYGLRMIKECGLTWEDMWMPKPPGQKPVQIRKARPISVSPESRQ